jgi:hypothetical protein
LAVAATAACLTVTGDVIGYGKHIHQLKTKISSPESLTKHSFVSLRRVSSSTAEPSELLWPFSRPFTIVIGNTINAQIVWRHS